METREGKRMSDNRIAIPNELRRRVLIEAGHRCAIPKCRYIQVEVHHIIPWEQCKEHEYDNLIALCPNCHRRADRGEIDRKSLYIYKANLRTIHDKYSHFEIDVLVELYRLPAGTQTEFPTFLLLLVRRLIEAEYLYVQNNPIGEVVILGMQINPLLIRITDKGREFVDSWAYDSGN